MPLLKILRGRLRVFVVLYFYVLVSVIANGQDRYYAKIPVAIASYKLPSGRNGLAETSFKINGRVAIKRLEKSTSVELFLDWSEGRASNPDPSFKYDYVYEGVHYGDQHLGKEPFYDIAVEKGSVKFKTVIMYAGQTIERESNYILGNVVGKGPVDLEAKDVTVFITGITWVGFTGTNKIENQIKVLAEEKRKKDNYAQLIKDGDLLMSQKNWSASSSKFTLASSLYPQESYPKNQLNKINELKNAEALKNQQASTIPSTSKTNPINLPDKNNANTNSSSNTNGSVGTKSTSTGSQGTRPPSSSPSSSGGIDRSKLPQLVTDNTGKYYQKDANNNYKEISYNQYQQAKSDALKLKQNEAKAEKDANDAKILKEYQDKAKALDDRLLKSMNPDPIVEAQKWANQQQSFYAAQSLSDARNSVANNSRLKGNFNSVEEIEAEFNQKYRSINQDVENLKTAKNDKLQADYNTLFYDADEKGKALGQLAVGIGSLINEASAAREARKAKEALEAQRRAETAKIEEKKRLARIEIRNKLLSQFPDGGLPLSSHNILVDEVYFFSYSFDKSTIDKLSPVLFLTNLFPIAKYGDGTWPFKSGIMNEISNTGMQGSLTIMGYYTTLALAERMRNSFKALSEKSGFIVKEISYKGKKAPATGNGNTDFWGNEVKTSTPGNTSKEPQNGTDFWGNPVKPNAKDTVSKKTPKAKPSNTKTLQLDFWGNPIKK